MKNISQGNGVDKDTEFFQDQNNDPVVLVSNSVWKGIGFIGINALILFPAVYFYELLPEAIQLIATPNMVVLIGFTIVVFGYIVAGKIISYFRKKKS